VGYSSSDYVVYLVGLSYQCHDSWQSNVAEQGQLQKMEAKHRSILTYSNAAVYSAPVSD